jgi:hypothetical protein
MTRWGRSARAGLSLFHFVAAVASATTAGHLTALYEFTGGSDGQTLRQSITRHRRRPLRTTYWLATGHCSIKATQTGNGTYDAATPVVQGFHVKQ